jgi:hypothetical protein
MPRDPGTGMGGHLKKGKFTYAKGTHPGQPRRRRDRHPDWYLGFGKRSEVANFRIADDTLAFGTQTLFPINSWKVLLR